MLQSKPVKMPQTMLQSKPVKIPQTMLQSKPVLQNVPKISTAKVVIQPNTRALNALVGRTVYKVLDILWMVIVSKKEIPVDLILAECTETTLLMIRMDLFANGVLRMELG